MQEFLLKLKLKITFIESDGGRVGGLYVITHHRKIKNQKEFEQFVKRANNKHVKCLAHTSIHNIHIIIH